MVDRFARVELALTPSPLQRLHRFSEHLGVDFYCKRDDLTGDVGLAGNKVRKLEYLLGEALAGGATQVLTTGGPQSNHARATAAAAARLGLGCVLILAGRDPGARTGNLLLDHLYGAEIRFPGAITADDQVRALHAAAAELESKGARPYVVALGGSNPLGVLGSLRTYEEMYQSLPDGTVIACATGSGGTHAGLALGNALHGNRHKIVGYSVWRQGPDVAAITRGLVRDAASLIGKSVPDVDVTVDDRYLAPRYGKASPAGLEAIRLMARLEGILLDHIYTGKAMAGLLEAICSHAIPPGSPVCFVHTGGAPALFTDIAVSLTES